MFHDNADEYGVPWKGEPTVRRETVVVEPSTGRSLSALVWGAEDPEIVLLHGGAQNAHTWDTVALALAPDAAMVVGMSLGGLTSIALAAHAPDLVRKLVLVDVTPGVDKERAAPIAQFVSGPESFESFDEILQRTIEYNPTRSVESLRRGV